MESTRRKPIKRTGSPVSNVIPLRSGQALQKAHQKPAAMVCFDRHEIGQMMQVYSRKVATGEWRDYAIDMLEKRAVFSVFKRSREVPLFTIEKTPKLAKRQGAWSVTNSTGQILKRGHELSNVLKVLEKQAKLVSA